MALHQYPCILTDRSQHALFSSFCVSLSGTMLVSLWHSYCQFIPGSFRQRRVSELQQVATPALWTEWELSHHCSRALSTSSRNWGASVWDSLVHSINADLMPWTKPTIVSYRILRAGVQPTLDPYAEAFL